MKKGNPCGKKW